MLIHLSDFLPTDTVGNSETMKNSNNYNSNTDSSNNSHIPLECTRGICESTVVNTAYLPECTDRRQLKSCCRCWSVPRGRTMWPPASTARPQPRMASTVCREHRDMISSPAQNWAAWVFLIAAQSVKQFPALAAVRVHYCVRWSSSWVALANTQLAMKFFTFYDYERRGSNRRLQKSVPLRVITWTLISAFLYIRLHN